MTGVTILLVEDDKFNQKLVRAVLARSTNPAVQAATLVEAGNLAEARAMLAAAPADIIVLDMNLPDGSGQALLAELTPGRGPAIIAVTGGGRQAQDAALSAGCSAVLTKPYDAADLRDLVAGLLTAGRGGAPAATGPIIPGTEITSRQAGTSSQLDAAQALDFRSLFESTSGPYMVLAPDLRIIAASDAFLRRIGLARADIIGQSVFGALPAAADGTGRNAELHASLDRARQHRRPDAIAPQSYPAPIDGAAGGGFEVRYASPVSTPVTGPSGEISCIIHQLRDVTDYVRLNREQVEELERRTRQTDAAAWEQSSRMPGPGPEFTERLAHELRSPLNTIIGFGELLGLGDVGAAHREWISMMLTAARHLVHLLDDSRDLASVENRKISLAMEAVSVLSAITDVTEIIRPLAMSRGVQLDPLPSGAAADYTYADGERLRQVLLNLLSNAIKYNHPAGNVTISVERQGHERLRINVTDTGRGIADGNLVRLFQPFERLDSAQAGIEGTGLGLALSRDLIEAMGGSIGVTSTEGSGSTFWIELARTEPVAVSQLAIGPSTITASRGYDSPKTVLYVEDMVENLKLVDQILRQRPSLTVIPAMLAGVALDLARQHHPDMILLDLRMPDMAGEEFLAVLKADAALAGIPVVILTADTSAATAGLITSLGAAAFLAKPIGVRELLETVDRVLGEPQASLDTTAAADPIDEDLGFHQYGE
jgi:signal transduction histidine kinase/DNA-binding response OmpR family regulator